MGEEKGQWLDFRYLGRAMRWDRRTFSDGAPMTLSPLFCATFCTTALAMAFASPAAAAQTPAVIGEKLADGTGYASLVRLAHQRHASDNGRVLLVFEQHGMAGVPLYVSNNEGGSWHFQQNVVDQAHAGNSRWQLRWQPHISELSRASGPLPAGTVLLAADATGNDAQGREVAQDLQLYASIDQGHTWTFRGSIIKGDGQPSDYDNRGVWEPNVHVLDDGRLVAYYSSEQHKAEGYNQLLAHKVSTDGGRSWGAEHVDVSIPGGVQRPGMTVVTRLPNAHYVLSYENIDGPHNGQVFLKFSDDGLNFGNPHEHGTPVRTMAGGWPAASPMVQWLPLGENPAKGMLVVLAERAGGGVDEGGRSLWWNANDGRGPWWRAAAPVQKRTGNIHAGWTQALLVQKNGKLLQVTSSSDAQAPDDASRNVMLFQSHAMRFDRYEAEDAARHAAVQIGDSSASMRGKARVASAPEGALEFNVHLQRSGTRELVVRWQDLGFSTQPRVIVDGEPQRLVDRAGRGGWHLASARVSLTAGDHRIVLRGGPHALDVDYLQLAASGAPPIHP